MMNDRAESQKLAFDVLRDVSEDIIDEEDIDNILGLLLEPTGDLCDALRTAGEAGVDRATFSPSYRYFRYYK